MALSAHYAGGSLSIRLDVKKGRIVRIRFFGDFMARSSLHELETAMSGCRFEHEEVYDVLRRFSMPDLFGSITLDEVMRTMFGN
jgi:lipoate-protein ligase A